MTDLAAPIGQRLKAERERRGLSPQKAADELRLDAWVIEALEAEDYGRVGPAVYAKGHLKRYAAFLGLPAAEIIAGYESHARTAEVPASQSASVRLRTDSSAVSNVSWPPIAASAAAALLLLGVLWWKPWHQRGAVPANRGPVATNPSAARQERATDSGGGESPGAEVSGAAAPAVISPTLKASLPPAATAPGAAAVLAPASATESDATAGTGRARLRLRFSADSWVDVHDAAGRRAFAGNGRANSVKTIAGIAPMRVYLGFASGVQLEINNRAVAIGPQFVSGDVARFEAGADGVLRRDPRSTGTPGAATPTVQTRNVHPTG